MDYGALLERAVKNLPSSVKDSERFSVPKVRGHVQGNRTIIANFVQICDTLRREQDIVLKFILKELATPGEMKNNLLVIGSKVSASRINEKIMKYVDAYVTCKECGKPDTSIIKQNRISFLKCSACGAKYPVVAVK
jgi:translation initiation factor 2 subunit 2